MKIGFIETALVSAMIANSVQANSIELDGNLLVNSQKTLELYAESNNNHILGNEHLLPKVNRTIQKDEKLTEQKALAVDTIQGSNTYTVGPQGNCVFSTLQAAVDVAGSGDVIKVTNSTFSGDDALVNIINKSLSIIGGYTNCDANALILGRTTLDGTGMSFADSIVEMIDSVGAREVTFRNFIIKNGQDDVDFGGGIEISGKTNATNQERLVINLNKVTVESNNSSNGAGVHLTNGKLTLDENSIIKANTASSNGGGIHCTDGDVTLQGDSVIGKDTAQATVNQALVGGGLYLDNCFLSQKTTFEGLLSGYTGGYISGNSAILGGGVAMYNNSVATLTGYKAQINLNTATNGAGLYINSGAFYGFNASVKGNQAATGGGAYLLDGTFSLQRNNSFFCFGKCTELSENTASQKGAALYHLTGAANNAITLNGAWIENNVATVDAAVIGSLGDPQGIYSIKNSMILNNSITDSASPSINALFDISGSVDFSMDLSTLSGSQSANQTDSSVFNFSTSGSISIDDSILGENGNNFSLALGTSAALISSNNNYFQFGGASWSTDPLFLVPGSNYHIRSDSPAIDAGPGIIAQLDVDGESRGELDNPADIGADEANLRVGINGGICNYESIALAISAAQSGDTIYIPKGNYVELIGTIDKNLTLLQSDATCENEQSNALAADLVVDGFNSFNSAGGLMNVAPDTDVIVKNMTLQKAKANFGGIIYVDSGANLTLDNVEVKDGYATQYGGGIRSHGYVTLINSKISGNMATSTNNTDAQSGGGIAISSTGYIVLQGNSVIISNDAVNSGGGIYTEATINIEGSSRIYANSATSGGGVYVTNSAVLRLSGTAIIGGNDFQNSASQEGGGVYCLNATLETITDSIINGNTATDGGGVYASGCTVHIFNRSKIGGINTGNSASAHGGGIYMTDSSSISMSADSEISYNNATIGGGIYLVASASSVTIQSGHVSYNTAVSSGGGMYVLANSTNFVLNLNNTDFQFNTATNGAGIAYSSINPSQFLIYDSRIAVNTASANGGGIYVFGSQALTFFIIDNSFSPVNSTNGITLNSAGTFGGGIAVVNSTKVELISATVNGNTATDGAGLYLFNGAEIKASQATSIDTNIASNKGGGVFVDNRDVHGVVTLNSSSMSFNQANFGGGLYLESEQSAGPSLQVYNSTFFNNKALNSYGVFYIIGGEASIKRSLFYSNIANGGSVMGSDFTTVLYENSVFYANTGTEVFNVMSLTRFTMNDSTVVSEANNNLFEANASGGINIKLNNTIISGFSAIALPEDATTTSVCTFDSTGVVGSIISPLFVDAANHDYHLQNSSGAKDACSTGTSTDFDLNSRPVGNGPAPYDAGAFENQTSGTLPDAMFANGFE